MSPISNISINAGGTQTVNVVAVDLSGDAITLTETLPAFVTLNAPTTGTGSVSTTLTIAPGAGDVGTHTGSVIATAGGEVDSTTFTITVNAAGTNQAPTVTAPATQTTTEEVNLSFTVTATDAEADTINTLTATGLPAGATFTPNGDNTSGAFSWTPTSSQSGDYDVVFTATSGTSSGAATTHIHVIDSAPIVINAINDLTIAAGTTTTVNVNLTGPTTGTTTLTASLPSWGTLNAPTSSTGTGTLSTTISLVPPTGTTGTFNASVTATNGSVSVTEAFVITVTSEGGGGGMTATARMLGAFNPHRKFICFRVTPDDGSFDARNVDLSGISLTFNGTSIHPLMSKSHVSFDCDDDGDDCDECEGDDDDDDDAEHADSLNCEASLHVCFAMTELRNLVGDQAVSALLLNGSMTGTLTTGETWTATFGTKFAGSNGHGNEKSSMHSKVSPNPLNPTAKLTFTLARSGRVTVAVFDLQGRLIKTLMDETRAAGEQSLEWDGSNTRGGHVSSGVYFFRIHAPQGEEIQRATVLK